MAFILKSRPSFALVRVHSSWKTRMTRLEPDRGMKHKPMGMVGHPQQSSYLLLQGQGLLYRNDKARALLLTWLESAPIKEASSYRISIIRTTSGSRMGITSPVPISCSASPYSNSSCSPIALLVEKASSPAPIVTGSGTAYKRPF